jgi:hypothetical protein
MGAKAGSKVNIEGLEPMVGVCSARSEVFSL